MSVPSAHHHADSERCIALDTAARNCLAAAAVIAQAQPQADIPLSLWAGVAGVGETALLEVVEQAVDARIIETDGLCALFSDPTIRDALYAGLRLSRQRELHRRAGELLAASEVLDVDAIAEHFARARDDRATAWLFRSGVLAFRNRRDREALMRFESALAAFAVPYDASCGDAADGWTPTDRQHLAAYARVHSGLCYCRMSDYRRGLTAMRAGVAGIDLRAVAASTRLCALLEAIRLPPDRRGVLLYWLVPVGHYAEGLRLGAQLLGDTAPNATRPAALFAAQIFWGLGLVHAAQARPEAAQRAYDRARAAYAAANYADEVGYTAVQELLWIALPYAADDVTRRAHLAAEGERLLQHARTTPANAHTADEYRPGFSYLPLMIIEGRWDEAHALASALRADGTGGGVKAIPTRLLVPLARERGEEALAWSIVHEEVPFGPDMQPGETIFPTTIVLQRVAALLALDAGDLATARQWLEAHDRWLAWNGTVLGKAEGELCWAAYHRAAGDTAAAQTHAERALCHAREPRQPLALIAAHRSLGELDLAAGRLGEATRNLDAALALADACRAVYERALTLLALTELRIAEGNRSAAESPLAESREILTMLGAAPALARADALAGALAAPSSAPTFPDGLSAREVDVRRRLAPGGSTPAVAAARSITERTVNRHIANIYTKIDAHGRAEATAYALRHPLV
jgi:DNA-binding CsgD family transcriptional regulator